MVQQNPGINWSDIAGGSRHFKTVIHKDRKNKHERVKKMSLKAIATVMQLKQVTIVIPIN